MQPDSFDENIAVNTRAPFFLAQSFSACWRSRNRKRTPASLDYFRQLHQRHHAGNEPRRIHDGQNRRSAAARLFAARLCEEQIGVYEVRPGLIKTEMTIPATAYYDELIAKGLVPWGRWGFPADIASTVRAMAEGKLIYTCGQAVAIDGGLSMPRF
jgi:NAD(P)-dependent dehydrogenase (short-subunit alcohol dehydrogenase family)